MTVIAAGLIVRNEARCIRRCLESIRPWVDRIIVLDTGSTDATARLARRSGAQVHHMAWEDSFAAARNRMLALADADWTIVLDADEWVAEGGAALRGWCAGAARLGRVCVSSRFDAVGGAERQESRGWITRVLPRGIRYEGRVHEQVVSDLPRDTVPMLLGHDGYLDAQLARKRDRNRPLLLLDHTERPDDPYVLYQLGKDAQMRGDHAEACSWLSRALPLTGERANWRHDLVLTLLHCLSVSGKTDEALALAEEEGAIWSTSPDFHFVLGGVLLDRAANDPSRALGHWLPQVCAAWRRCLEIGERPELEGSVAGRGSHLARHNLDMVEAQLAALGR